MRFLRIALALAAPFALAATLAAQSLEVQLQRAVQREAATGDQKAAIAEYRRIAERAGANRTVAAQALLRLADAHRDLGDAEAGKVYQRIVSGFADQTQVAAVAQTRLASSRTTASIGIAKRRVWFGAGSERPDVARVSPDGRFLAFAQTNSSTLLVVRDLKVQSERTSVPASENRRIETLVWSRDSSRVAIRLREQDGLDEIRIVTADGASSRTLLQRPPEYQAWWVCDWAADGRLLVAVRGTQSDRIGLVWINSSNAAIRPITEFQPMFPAEAFVSPDGTTIVFGGVRGASGGREIHLIRSDGSSPAVLSADRRDSYPAGWLPGNREVLVVSQRGAKVGLWALPVPRGTSEEARAIEEDLCLCGELVDTTGSGGPVRAEAQVETLGVTSNGDVFFRTYRVLSDVYVASTDTHANKTAPTPVPVTVSRNGRNVRPQWSPDGRRILLIWNSPSLRQLSVIDVGARTENRLDATIPPSPSGHCWAGNDSILLTQRVPGKPADFIRKELTAGKDTIVFQESSIGDTSCSLNGRIVGYPSSGALGESYFRVRNLDTGSITDLRLPLLSSTATLSPDGKLVAFISAVSRALSVHLIDAGATRELVRANAPEQFLYGTVLAWSPDSRFVYYVKHRDWTSYSEVFRMLAAGGPEEPLGINGADLRNLSISPDGARIAFAMGPRNRPEIWAIENTAAAK